MNFELQILPFFFSHRSHGCSLGCMRNRWSLLGRLYIKERQRKSRCQIRVVGGSVAYYRLGESCCLGALFKRSWEVRAEEFLPFLTNNRSPGRFSGGKVTWVIPASWLSETTLEPHCLSPAESPQSPLRRGKSRNLPNGSLASVIALLFSASQMSCKNLPWRQQGCKCRRHRIIIA